MTEQESRLCGAYTPNPERGFSLPDFLGSNIVELFELIHPGGGVQFISSDTLLLDPKRAVDFMFDYVPVQGGTPIFGSSILKQGVSTTHFFIYRPSMINTGLQNLRIDPGALTPTSLGTWWHLIGFNLRKMLQRTRMDLQHQTLTSLTDVGVHPIVAFATVRLAHLHAQENKLTSNDFFIFADKTFVGTDVASFVLGKSQKGSLNLAEIAARITRGCPKK